MWDGSLRHTLQTESRIAPARQRHQPVRRNGRPETVRSLRPVPGARSAPPRYGRLRESLWQAVSGRQRYARMTIRALRDPDWRQPAAAHNPGALRRGAVVSRADGRSCSIWSTTTPSTLRAISTRCRRRNAGSTLRWPISGNRRPPGKSPTGLGSRNEPMQRATEAPDRSAESWRSMGGTERRKLYYVAERLYNIYYLMRRVRGNQPP